MKNLLKAIGFLLLVMTVYFLANMIPGLIIGMIVAFQNVEAMSNAVDANALMTKAIAPYSLHIMIFAALTTLVMICLFFLGRKDRFLTYIKLRQLKLKDGLYIALLGIFLNLLFIALLNYAALYLPIESLMSQYSDLMTLAFDANFFIVLLAVVVIAPIFEEVLIRGVIFNDFRKACPTWFALIIQALIFGLMHMNIIQGTYAFFLGLILGLLYLSYHSILAAILLHMTFNLTSTLLSSFMPSSDAHMGIIFIIGLLGSGTIAWLLHRQYDPKNYLESTMEVSPSFLQNQ